MTTNIATPDICCAACGNDVQQAGGKPVKVVTLPGVDWSKAPNPQAAWAIVRKAQAEGRPQVERVLCCRCAGHAD